MNTKEKAQKELRTWFKKELKRRIGELNKFHSENGIVSPPPNYEPYEAVRENIEIQLQDEFDERWDIIERIYGDA